MALFPKFSKKREGVNVVMEQRLLQSVNNLILNSETCTGCGICVEACPEEAIVLGLVGASRRGAINYAAPVDVDEVKCSYCGVCVVMCPFNALTLKVDGQEKLPILEKEGFPQYDMKAEIDDEKCTRCTICEEVCPRDAIDRNVPAYEGTYKGPVSGAKDRQTAIKTKTTFKVDMEKCSLCGICGALCPAITVKHKEFTAETGKVESVADPVTGSRGTRPNVMPVRYVLKHVPKSASLSSAKLSAIKLRARSALSRITAAPASGVHGTARPKQ